MRIDIMTLFPEQVTGMLTSSILGRAEKKGILEINCVQIRDFTENKQQQTDDYPYGGGWGCVMMAQPLKSCLDHIAADAGERRRRVIYLSPQGATFTQATAKRLSREYDHIVLVCGHYEGIDERFIEECVDEELSIGDYVLTGGEIAAAAVTDSVCRLVPGVLSDEECYTGESHWDGLLEYPQYTRPEMWEGRAVPPVLLTGNHADVARWRRRKQLERTMDKRPDMMEGLELTDAGDLALLAEIAADRAPKEPPKPVFDCRRAVEDDVPALMDIAADASAYLHSQGVDQWQDGYPRPEVFLRDISLGDGWIFTCDGNIAGYSAFFSGHEPTYEVIRGRWLTEGERYGVIHRSMIAARYRGSGLSREMFSLAEDLFAGMGKVSVRVDTHPQNGPMNALAKRLGYVFCGTIDVVVAEGHDSIRNAYEKILTF